MVGTAMKRKFLPLTVVVVVALLAVLVYIVVKPAYDAAVQDFEKERENQARPPSSP
jgi:uncharacterized protein involved in exopolysaccharide biosynthesis